MKRKARLKINAAAPQFPVTKARGIRTVATADLDGLGVGEAFLAIFWRRWGLIYLIFESRHHRSKFARKEGQITIAVSELSQIEDSPGVDIRLPAPILVR
jgi:hypothetical protein